jgi:hypothetical protein
LTYGTPQAGGNVLDFANNLQFSSISGGATPSDFVDGKLVVDIMAKTQPISQISVFERGTYSFGFGGTATTLADVQLLGAAVNITEINGSPITPIVVPGTMAFTPGSLFKQTIDPLSGAWSGTMTFDLAGVLKNTPYDGKNITKAKLIFDNQLETVAGTSTHSFIDKKDVQITTVPEPSCLALLCMGAIGIAVWTRRRKA